MSCDGISVLFEQLSDLGWEVQMSCRFCLYHSMHLSICLAKSVRSSYSG